MLKGEMNMFRNVRRTKNIISEEETISLLKNEKRGVIAMNGEDGYPYAIPVNYYYDQDCHKIYFHGSKRGYKVDALRNNDKVCFTVYGHEVFKEDWAPYLQSAVVFGTCHLVEDDTKTVEKVRKLANKYYPTSEEVEAEIKKDIKAVQLYEISIQHLTGKQIHEK